MNESSVEIRQQMGRWTVSCGTCAGLNFLNFYPWATAANHRTAITLADWHIAEHQRTTCDHCRRTDEIERPVAIDESRMTLNGRLYEIRTTGVVAIGTAAPRKANA